MTIRWQMNDQDSTSGKARRPQTAGVIAEQEPVVTAPVVLLGTILDSASIMLLTLPIALPILMGANVDLIWLGVLTVLAVEIGLLTPPFGIAVFVIKATLGPDSRITLGEIFIGALPFAVMMALVLALVFLFPSLATALL